MLLVNNKTVSTQIKSDRFRQSTSVRHFHCIILPNSRSRSNMCSQLSMIEWLNCYAIYSDILFSLHKLHQNQDY